MAILDAIRSFSGTEVWVIGDIILDIYLYGKVDRISPEAPIPILNHTNTRHALGGAANVAANLKGLGANVSLFSLVGADKESEYLVTMLDLEEINHHLVSELDRPTTSKTRVIAGNHQMIRIDHESTVDIIDESLKAFQSTFTEQLKVLPPQAIVLEDYNKGLLTNELITFLLTKAKELEIPVIVDPKKSNFFSFQGCTLFKPNIKECASQVPFPVSADKTTLDKADKYFREKLNHQTSMITLAEHGIYISDGHSSFIMPTEIRQVADVSGAGDTVTAVATLGVMKALSLMEIAQLSNQAAGHVCSIPGVHAIQLEELIHFYQ